MSTDDPTATRRHKVRGKLLESLPKGGIVAEVGVWEGNFSQRILEICAPKELHLIDPWLFQPEFGGTGFGRKKNKDRMQDIYEEVRTKFADTPAVSIHRGKSEDAFAAFEDGYFDWVYLDGNHHAPFIDNDIAIALEKVKPNGIIAGDDYNWKAEKEGAPVRTAVGHALDGLGDAAELQLMGQQWMLKLRRG